MKIFTDVCFQTPNWLEDDDDLTTRPAVGTQAYVPQDDFDLSGDTTSQPPLQADTPTASGPSPKMSTNFDGGYLSLNHYRRYFNLSTSDFFKNVMNSINILSHVEDEEELGDMYGPIWVTGTVIFFLFFSNTCSSLLTSWFLGGDAKYEYNFSLLTGAITLLYGYTFVIPLVFHLVSVYYFKLTGLLPLSKLISIYGYANSAWVPAAILGTFRGFLANHSFLSNSLKWISVLLGGLISGAAILSKVYPVVKNSTTVVGNDKLGMVLCGLLGAAHIGLIIAVKVSFFGDLSVV
ncbi:CYFA0S05e04236g1_1 [Cyberlindnera fabianii]|uniref:CYFA0S05e04236g1_1 n=1 Tax=Cyberlindnera fabianii TaxID=36022 RepID=A0A061AT53_CYBFA|nr:CYFA0S05e04236g1_1 [Cyberlindnera fabianii]